VSNTIFIRATATFDENLFPCCPTAQTPHITNSDEEQPEDLGTHSHELPKNDSNHSPRDSPDGDDFNSGNYPSSEGPPSPGQSKPRNLSENDKERNRNDMHVPDVASDSLPSDSEEENPPRSHTQPSEPLPKYQKSKDLPHKSAV